MRAILGIGNPGNRYENTRHNVGFTLIDRLAQDLNLSFLDSKYDFYYAGGNLFDSRFLLIKPTTYVNRSGQAALDVINNFNINISDFLIIYDDINLKLGDIRIRKKGGDGGHNGINSIIYDIQTDQFPRIRFGIGSEFEKGYMADYVLSKFSSEEYTVLKNSFDITVELMKKFITGGTGSMLDHYSKIYNQINSPINSNKDKQGD